MTLTKADISESAFRRFRAKQVPCGDCHIWIGSLNNKGYGQLQLGRVLGMRYAHRISWVMANGDLPSEILVLHRCDEPRCVNPEHLFLGTAKDNTADMVRKGRHAWKRGTRWQKLNATDGTRICDLRAAGCTQQEISDWFGVSRPLISMILAGKIIHSAHLVQ